MWTSHQSEGERRQCMRKRWRGTETQRWKENKTPKDRKTTTMNQRLKVNFRQGRHLQSLDPQTLSLSQHTHGGWTGSGVGAW